MVFLQSVRWKMLISHFVIVVISIILFVFSNSRLIYIVRETVEQFNSERLGSMQSNVDVLVTQVGAFDYSIQNSPDVKSAVGDYADSALYQKVMTDFTRYSIYNDYIKDIMIYLPKKDFIISGTNATDFFYYGNARFTDYEAIHTVMQGEYNGVYLVMPFKSQNYVNNYPVYAKTAEIDGERVNIFIVLDVERLMAPYRDDEEIFILNENNQLIGIPKTVQLPQNLSYCDMGRTGYFRFGADSKEYVVQYTSSATLPWKYVLISTEESYMSHIRNANFVAFFGLLLLSAAGIVTAVFLSKKNYKPIKILMDVLKGKDITKEENPLLYSEYQYIGQRVNELLESHDSLMRQFNEKKHLIRENLLENILLGRLLEVNLQENMEYHDIIFKTDIFAVLRLEVKEYDDAFEGNINLLYYGIKNVAEELLNQADCGYVTESGGVIYTIVNLQDDVNAAERLRRSAETVAKTIHDVLGAHILVVVSRVRKGISSIEEGYRETLKYSQYRISEDYEVIMSEDASFGTIDSGSFFHFANMLINDCALGDADKATEHIKRLLELLLQQEHILSDYSVYQLFLVLSAIKSERTANKEALLFCLQEQKEQAQLFEFCISLVKEICQNARTKNQKQSELIVAIKSIVKANLLDSQMNLNFIAQKLNMNAKYLSRVYSQETGYSLVDYINAERINMAREILAEEPKIRIEDLYQRCGFTNIRTFRRTFMKYTGVSPSNYKTTV